LIFHELPAGAEAFRGGGARVSGGGDAGIPAAKRSYTWSGWSEDFTRKMGARGWIGMTWPKRYGGGERSALERYVLLEELLAAGAPVGAHWVADRQSGPLILKFGTEEQKSASSRPSAAGSITSASG
jgi:alkylation response protein AidB-like acyl-CoA dehydrogenase